MEIVTGSTGEAHVTPIDDAVRNSNFGFYSDRIVFDTFRALEAVAITANEVRVYGGYGMNQGRLFKIDLSDYDSVTIENGSQGVKRADLIVARYTMDSQTGFEDISLAVIKGQSGQTYTDPAYTVGNINEGDTLDDFPLYRVKINGIVIEAVEPMFTATPDGGRLGILEKRLDGEMKTNLASENSGTLDGSEEVDIGVKGILPVSHGGTGGNSTSAAAKNIVIDNLTADATTMTDSTEFISSESSSGFSAAMKKRTGLNIWSYILSKIKTLLGMGNTEIVSVSHGGTGKATITSGKVLVGNGTSTPSEKGIATSLSNPSDDDLPTTKAVSDALAAGGYGDMLSSTWTSNGYLAENKGGIGARGFDSTSGGTANSSALVTSGALYDTKTAIDNALTSKANTSALGTQVTYSLSGTALTITTKS